jgi:pimeloyl-ACP methyl ester carboxylesterase
LETQFHQPPQLAQANGIELCYEIFGAPDAEPLILIMGLGAQMVQWDDEFCWQLAGRGFRVIRFDNRDIGKSTQLANDGMTPIEWLKWKLLRMPPPAPYKLCDMAGDVAGLMDALGMGSAHVVGLSMGGMIAQELVLNHPRRVRTLTSIMSSPGNPWQYGPTREAAAILFAPPATTHDAFVARYAHDWRILRAGSFPLDEARDRERAETVFARGLNPAGVARQYRAILASGDRKSRLPSVKVPTLVIHGTLDPLVPPGAGKDTAASIPGAKLLMIEGMGHALPVCMWPRIVQAIAEHVHAARTREPST